MSIPRPAADAPPRCLVLLPGAPAVAQPLLHGLRQRSIEPTILPHPAAVMAALPRYQPRLVIIVEPDRVPWLAQLHAAIARYYPNVRCWQYAPDNLGRFQLEAVNPSITNAYKIVPTEQSSPDPLPTLAGQPLEPLLTADELDMLLSPGKTPP